MVRDADGNPVAGAEVFVREDPSWLVKRRARSLATQAALPLDRLPPLWTVASGAPNARCTSDAGGRVQFERVVPWTPELLVQSQHPRAGGCQAKVGPIGAPGTTLEVLLAPTKPPVGGILSGVLTINGSPALGRVEWRGATRTGSAAVAPDGHFRVVGVEPGELLLQVRDVQTRTTHFGARFDDLVERATVELDRETTHDFRLECARAELRGQIVSDAGAARAGVPVSVRDELDGIEAHALSELDGSVRIEVPATERAWKLTASDGPLSVGPIEVRVNEPFSIALPALGRVRIRAVQAGTELALAPLSAFWRRKGARGIEPRALALEALADAPGEFEARVPLGEVEIWMWLARAGWSPSAPQFVGVTADRTARLEFTLAIGCAQTFVLAPSGVVPRDARVFVLESAWWAQRTAGDDVSRNNVVLPRLIERLREISFDATGRGTARGLAPGRYRFVTGDARDCLEPAEFTVESAASAALEVTWKRRE